MGYRWKGGEGGDSSLSKEINCVLDLIELLPPVGSVWPKEKQHAWLRTAEELFNLIYIQPSDALFAQPPIEQALADEKERQ